MEKNNQFQIELPEDVAQGIYANLAIITHSSSEFVLDFARVLPGVPKAKVNSRMIMSPEHACRLMHALQENIAKYERVFGLINIPGENFFPNISGAKGEAWLLDCLLLGYLIFQLLILHK